MSKIVSPYPPYEGEVSKDANASWWRLTTPVNDDGHILVFETDAKDETSTPTWCSWEFFDGHDTMIDAGLDRPVPVRITHHFTRSDIDILYVGPPTPSPLWRPLTKPGNHQHPEGDLMEAR